MAREERCREHAGGIEVERWARAVSMQAHINGDVQTDDGTNDRPCREQVCWL